MKIDGDNLIKIINHYGKKKQESKAVEELIELAELVIKDVNKNEWSAEDMYEEIADVFVMLSQLIIIFEIDIDYLQLVINRKIQRTLKRIEVEPDCQWK